MERTLKEKVKLKLGKSLNFMSLVIQPKIFILSSKYGLNSAKIYRTLLENVLDNEDKEKKYSCLYVLQLQFLGRDVLVTLENTWCDSRYDEVLTGSFISEHTTDFLCYNIHTGESTCTQRQSINPRRYIRINIYTIMLCDRHNRNFSVVDTFTT